MNNKLFEEIIRFKELMGIVTENKVFDSLPEEIKLSINNLKSKWGVTITQKHIDAEFKQEGNIRPDNGGVSKTAEKKIMELIKDCKKANPNISYPVDIKSGYRSYTQQVDNFGGKVKNDGRSIDNVQSSNCLPGFSQHHTGKAFDIFSIEESWWDKNNDVKEWVANNASNYGFEVTYKKQGPLRVAEPWHLFYVGKESTNLKKDTPIIPDKKIDDYYSNNENNPKLEKETVIQFKKVGCSSNKNYTNSPTFSEIDKDDSKVIRIGHKGEFVIKIQKILNSLGYDLGKCGVDGLFGPKTKAALEEFQNDKGILVSSSVNKKTLDNLKNLENKEPESEIKKDKENSVKYVIFVSGSEKSKNHEEQLSLFTRGFGTEYLVKGFKQTSLTSIVDFIKKNTVVAVILYSASCELADNLVEYFSSNKIFCIEPWNGNGSDANKKDIYVSIPEKNMYIDYKSYSRGKGTKEDANKTNHENGHFVALTTSSADISKKV
jgi:LAS superfamily LD-carboxypeptidase LdcB